VVAAQFVAEAKRRRSTRAVAREERYVSYASASGREVAVWVAAGLCVKCRSR
jgi:hypothetical protein